MVSPALGNGVSTNIMDAPSGAYRIDPSHTRVSFKINHLGFSYYTGRFDSVEGRLNLDTQTLSRSTLDATVNVNSINLGDSGLEEDLRGDKWFNVIEYPMATFHMTGIERKGNDAATITGDLTILGVTQGVALDAVLIGTGVDPVEGQQVIGFSASGLIHRSDYHLTNLLPMIGNDVILIIDGEFDKTY